VARLMQGSSVLSEALHHRPIPQDDRVTGVRPLVRLYGTKHTHRLLPAPLAISIAAAFRTPVRRHRKAAERREAECFMKDLLLYTPRAAEAPRLAQRHIKEKARMIELVWRPWLLKRSRVIGTHHWEAAHSGGRGCVVVMGHMGGTFAVAPILVQNGFDCHTVTSPHYWQPMPPGLVGLAILHLRTEYAEKPLGWSRLIPSDAKPQSLVELLESGASILIAFDVPGTAATPFLGRSVALSGGPATLAFRTGVKVLPVIPERHGSRYDLRMLKPLDPADYPDLRSLRAAIARTFEPIVLAKPEMVELPWYPSPLVNEVPSSPREEDAPRGESAPG
jgi:lauroyl/myristoyl acyltransferase